MTVAVTSAPAPEPARVKILRLASTVDWLTATVPIADSTLAHTIYGRSLVTREVVAGNPRSSASLHGYVGWTAGRATYGERHDGLYICARGALAETVWQDIVNLGYIPSRIDLAVTVWYAEPRDDLARVAYASCKAATGREGRKTSATYVASTEGGSTCYVGSRSSERYGRLYNKHAESQSAEYVNAWRYELELKSQQARLVAEVLQHDDKWRDRLADFVGRYFGDRGVAVDWLDSVGAKLPDPVPSVSSDSARLGWLATGVAPAVHELRERVGLRRILEALGIDASAIHDDRELDRPPARKPLVWRDRTTVVESETVDTETGEIR